MNLLLSAQQQQAAKNFINENVRLPRIPFFSFSLYAISQNNKSPPAVSAGDDDDNNQLLLEPKQQQQQQCQIPNCVRSDDK